MSKSDEALLRLWEDRRDPEVFHDLVERHAGMVLATCQRILGNAADAEEVAQDCFLRMAQGNTRVRASVVGWLHGLATSRSLDRLRADRQRRRREELYVAKAAPVSEPTWDDIQCHVDEAIAELPEKLREPLVRHFLLRQTHEAIANDLSVSRSSVTRRIEQGIYTLRRTLRRRGIAVSAALLAPLLAQHLAEAAPIPASLAAGLGRVALAAPKAAAASFAGGMAAKVAALAVFVGAMGGAIVWWNDSLSTVIMPVSTGAQVMSSATPVTVPSQPAKAEPTAPASKPASFAKASGTPAALPQRGRCSISGKVVQPDPERLVGHATVGAVSQGRIYRAQADGAGNFRIEGVPDGEYHLFAHTDTLVGFYFDSPASVEESSEDRREAIWRTIYVRPRTTTGGTVRDAVGNPIAGADVRKSFGSYEDLKYEWAAAFPIRTDAAGRFSTDSLQAGDKTTLVVKKEGYAPVSHLVQPGTDGNEFVLTQGSSLSGRVIFDGTDAPAAGAKVRALWQNGEPGEAVCDADGLYTIERLAAGVEYFVAIESDSCVALDMTKVTLEEGEAREGFDIVVSPGAYIRGRVTTKETGAGLAGVSLAAQKRLISDPARTLGSARKTVSGPDGQYRLGPLGPGDYELFCTARQGVVYRDAFEDYVHSSRKLKLEQDQEMKAVDFRFSCGSALSGCVLDRHRRPLPNARVAVAQQNDNRPVERKAMTEADGTFRVLSLSVNSEYKLIAQADGYAWGAQLLTLPPTGLNGVEIILEPEARMAGRVIDTRGEPVPYAQVSATPHPSRSPESVDEGVSYYPCGVSGWCEPIQCDGEGRFDAGGWPAGEFLLSVDVASPPVRSGIWPPNNQITLAVGEKRGDLELVIPAQEDTGIEGTVRDETGTPLSGVRVMACSGKGGRSDIRTDDAGHFVTGALPEGPVELVFEEGPSATKESSLGMVRISDVESGTKGLEVVLERFGHISGVLVDAKTGARVHGTVEVPSIMNSYGDGGPMTGRYETVQGVFKIDEVTPGTATLVVNAEGYATETTEVDVVPGRETSGVRIALQPE